MAFTNVWDTGFPADTQLANLLGQDIRNVHVDVQQRMASISGLDAAKPAFGTDAQPANWNGALFFATDTGKIYRWINPAWTDITSTFKLGSPAVFKQAAPNTHVGAGQILNFSLPALAIGNLVRIKGMFQAVNLGGGATSASLTVGNAVGIGTLGTVTGSTSIYIYEIYVCPDTGTTANLGFSSFSYATANGPFIQNLNAGVGAIGGGLLIAITMAGGTGAEHHVSWVATAELL